MVQYPPLRRALNMLYENSCFMIGTNFTIQQRESLDIRRVRLWWSKRCYICLSCWLKVHWQLVVVLLGDLKMFVFLINYPNLELDIWSLKIFFSSTHKPNYALATKQLPTSNIQQSKERVPLTRTIEELWAKLRVFYAKLKNRGWHKI